MRILVTGGRAYNNRERIAHEMRYWSDLCGPELVVIQGGAPGADTHVVRWCYANGVHVATMPALWEYYDKAAGPKRNAAMLLAFQPNMVLAFPGNVGTEDMITQAEAAGVQVCKVTE